MSFSFHRQQTLTVLLLLMLRTNYTLTRLLIHLLRMSSDGTRHIVTSTECVYIRPSLVYMMILLWWFYRYRSRGFRAVRCQYKGSACDVRRPSTTEHWNLSNICACETVIILCRPNDSQILKVSAYIPFVFLAVRKHNKIQINLFIY